MEKMGIEGVERKREREGERGGERKELNNSPMKVEISLDGSGISNVDTGIGFLDHMLSALAKHARFDLNVHCKVSWKEK